MKLIKFVPDNTNIDFLRWRKPALLLSILLIIGSIALVGIRGLNFGIDFEGGQTVRVTFQQPPNLDDLRTIVGNLQPGEDVSVQEFGSSRDIAIRQALPEDQSEGAADRAAQQLQAAIQQKYPGAQISAVDTVSGKVSGELIQTGALAMLFAMIGISIYIWFRFEWQFGVGAVVSTAHDVIMIVGVYVLFGLEFNLSSLAAILTVIGYSINDTVVIFDRIREMLRKYKKMPLEDVIDHALNQTLSRTFLTGVTVLLALFALYFFGGAVLSEFVFAIILGVFIGTYSSLFIAGPMLILFKLRPEIFDSEQEKEAAAKAAKAAKAAAPAGAQLPKA